MTQYYTALVVLILLFLSPPSDAQSIGIGTTSPNGSAQLDITSNNRGLLIPRLDSSLIKTIGNPAKGLMVYDSSRNLLLVNMGSASAPDWENIIAKSGWSLSGNSGLNDTAFIGTLDGSPLVLRQGNSFAGKIDIDDNIILGHTTMNTGSSGNISIGTGSLQVVSHNNIALGYVALSGTTGSDNIGIGQQTLGFSSGGGNIAIGFDALGSNTTASENVAIGSSAAEANSSGGDLTAVGNGALADNTTGNDNTATGNNALVENQTGSGNTAVGSYALFRTTNSWYNTVVGENSGTAYDNGYNNVFLGANCDVNGAGYFNVIAIGQDVICTGSSQARIGNLATSSIGGYANWTNFSDGRYKRNIRENVKGLDFILKLRPITYNLDVTGIRNRLGQTAPKDAGTQQSLKDREAAVLSGFSAQEVEQAAAASGYDFSGVDKPKNANDFYGLRYSDFVVPLVKAVQEQQKLIEAMQKRLDEQDRLIRQLMNNKNN